MTTRHAHRRKKAAASGLPLSIAVALIAAGCASATRPAAPLGPPVTQAEVERVVAGCDQVATGAVRQHFGLAPQGPQDSLKTGAATVGGLAALSIAVVPLVLPPVAALTALGGALATAGTSAVIVKIADRQLELEGTGFAAEDAARREVYLRQLTLCLHEHGVQAQVVQPAGPGKEP